MIRRRVIVILTWTLAAGMALACSGKGSGSAGGVTGATAEPAVETTTTAPAPTPSPTPTTASAQLGEKLTLTETSQLDGSESTTDITVSDLKVGLKVSYMKPEKGQFIAVKVTVLCRKGKHSVNAFDFKFVGPDGTVSDPEFGVAKPDLEAVDLAAAQKTSGYVAFDVAVGAQTGGRVALKDFSQGDLGYWALG